MERVNLAEKVSLLGEHRSPKVVGGLDGQHVTAVKSRVEIVGPRHDHEDGLVLVVKGRFRMDFRDRQAWPEEGESVIVPRGVEQPGTAVAPARVRSSG